MLNINKVLRKVDLNKEKTPFLVLDRNIIKRKYREIAKSIKGVKVFYAVKANADIEILKLLKKQGSGFEIASANELKKLQSIGVEGKDMISSNPMKIPEFIKEAFEAGIDRFVYDCKMEVDKIVAYAPGSKVYLRIVVDNTGSEWPLSKKFGAGTSSALELLQYAKKSKLIPYGITFHVGSQCLNPRNWSNALITTREVFDIAKRNGINLKMINMGGGIPIQHIKATPKISEIKDEINKTVRELFGENKIDLFVEPGRAIVGDSGHMVTSVILQAKRGSEKWLYIDAGVFNGLMETIEGFKYDIKTEKELIDKSRKYLKTPYVVAGPSCDSVDTMFKDYKLPKNIKLGDRILILNAGAYTTCYASNFNGFDPPKTILI